MTRKAIAYLLRVRSTQRNLDFMDWIAIAIFLAGIWIAIYATSLRRP